MTALAVNVQKRSIVFLLGMSSLMLGANVVWTAYNSILLPTLVENAEIPNKGLVVGLIGFFGTLIGILVSLLAGILSDHTTSQYGKRTPAILIGAILTLPLLGLASVLESPSTRSIFFSLALPIIVVSFCGMQFFTNVSNGAWWPLLVDVVPENQRGTAAGIQGGLTLVGAAAGIIWISILNQENQTGLSLWLIGIIFVLTGILNAVTIKGKDLPANKADRINIGDALRDMFRVRTRVVVFFWLVFAVLVAYMGISSLQFFARYFFEVYFPEINPDEAFRTMGGIILIVTMISSVVSGFLSDRIGRRRMILWSMFLCALTTLLMGLVTNYMLFLAAAALRAVATGPIFATAPALASDLAPKDEAGQYMAYNNLTTGLSAALSSLFFGVILIDLNRMTFVILFVVSAVCFLISGIVFSIKVTQSEIDQVLKRNSGSQ